MLSEVPPRDQRVKKRTLYFPLKVKCGGSPLLVYSQSQQPVGCSMEVIRHCRQRRGELQWAHTLYLFRWLVLATPGYCTYPVRSKIHTN